jgi:hypothetical protein
MLSERKNEKHNRESLYELQPAFYELQPAIRQLMTDT